MSWKPSLRIGKRSGMLISFLIGPCFSFRFPMYKAQVCTEAQKALFLRENSVPKLSDLICRPEKSLIAVEHAIEFCYFSCKCNFFATLIDESQLWSEEQKREGKGESGWLKLNAQAKNKSNNKIVIFSHFLHTCIFPDINRSFQRDVYLSYGSKVWPFWVMCMLWKTTARNL